MKKYIIIVFVLLLTVFDLSAQITPGLQLPFGIQPVNPVPVDAYYGPFTSTSQAISAIPQALRYDGLTVQITGSGNYWWLAADLTNTGLMPKITGGGGWSLTGNTGTNHTINFIGTTDDTALVFRANNVFSGMIDPSGSSNTFFGYNSGNFLTYSNSANTAFGNYCMPGINNGQDNVAVGQAALNSLTNGSYNTACGLAALESVVSSNANTAFGFAALSNVVSGINNTAVGNAALSLSVSSSNTAIGSDAGLHSTTGNTNTFLGDSAGYSNTIGSNNIYIGYKSGFGTTTSNQLFIGNSSNSSKGYLYNHGNGYITEDTTRAGGGGSGVTFSGGAVGQIAFFKNSSTARFSSNFFIDSLNQRLGIGTSSPANFITATGIQPVSVSTSSGTSAATTGEIALTGAQGGSTTIATTGVGGVGGNLVLTSGAGGTASSAVTSSTVGTAGSITIQSPAVSANTVASSSANVGGISGSVTAKSGNAGAASLSTGTNTGGQSGSITQQTGNGGNAGTASAGSGGVTANGGLAGQILFQTGGGGNAQHASGTSSGGGGGNITFNSGGGGSASSATTNNGGAAGSITFTAGSGGAGSTANGMDGSISFVASGIHGTGSVSMSSYNGQQILINDQTVLNNNGTTIEGAGNGVSIPIDVLALGLSSSSNGQINFSTSASSNIFTLADAVDLYVSNNSNVESLVIDQNNNIILNGSGSALPTSATNGFTYMATCAGVPTGTPARIVTGAAPYIYDTTDDRLYIYFSGAWHQH